MDWHGLIHRPDRIGWHQCATVHLCQPLVRPPARLGAALISSGTYIAGAIWPPIFQEAIANYGWRQTMLWYALARSSSSCRWPQIYFRPAPESHCSGNNVRRRRGQGARPRLAAQPRIRDDVRGRRVVLHADGDAAGPSGGFFAAISVSPGRWAP